MLCGVTKLRTQKARKVARRGMLAAPKRPESRRIVKRTSLNLPRDLVRDAQRALGTSSITLTVVRAMEEAVRLRLRLRLLERDMPGLTPELIERLRRPRVGMSPDRPAHPLRRTAGA